MNEFTTHSRLREARLDELITVHVHESTLCGCAARDCVKAATQRQRAEMVKQESPTMKIQSLSLFQWGRKAVRRICTIGDVLCYSSHASKLDRKS